MIAKCIRRCWDGKKARRYYPGDQDDITPGSPISKYFDMTQAAPEPVKKEEPTGGEGIPKGKKDK